jgi:hypothetical protein
MLRDSEIASHMNHEHVIGAIKIRFAVIGTVDVVLYFRPAHRIGVG